MRNVALFLVAFAIAVTALPGDMGYMLGTEVECDDFFCQNSHLSILNYTFPPPAEHKGTILVNVTASYPGSTTMFIGRTTAYDFNTGRYFLLTTMEGEGENEYTLYTIKVFNNPPSVSLVPVNQASKLAVTSMQYDLIDNIAYIVFDSSMYTIDTATGDITLIGPLSTASQIVPGLTTAYDSNTHNYWIAVDDEIKGTHNLLTYNTRSKTSFMTPSLNNGDYWTLYGMSYYAKLDQMIALTNDLRGYPSIKTVDYRTGTHVDLVPEWIWSDYDGDYSLWPQSSYTNGVVWLDPELNIFWITVMWADPETLADDDALLYYNLTKGGVEMGSGPMVIWNNAIEFTNYVWYNWNDVPKAQLSF